MVTSDNGESSPVLETVGLGGSWPEYIAWLRAHAHKQTRKVSRQSRPRDAPYGQFTRHLVSFGHIPESTAHKPFYKPETVVFGAGIHARFLADRLRGGIAGGDRGCMQRRLMSCIAVPLEGELGFA